MVQRRDEPNAKRLARAQRRSERKKEYEAYLASQTWRRIRRAALERDKHQCRACGQKAGVVHHICYPRTLGEEKMEWLYSLCAPCHDRIHSLVSTGKSIRRATAEVLGFQPSRRKPKKKRKKKKLQIQNSKPHIWREPELENYARPANKRGSWPKEKKLRVLAIENEKLHETQKQNRERRERRIIASRRYRDN